MKYLYFVEIEGVKYYKADTFWSRTEKLTHAKHYGSGNQLNLLEPFGYNFKHLFESNPEKYLSMYEKYNGSILGFSKFEDDITDESEPLDTHYLLVLHLDSKAEYHYTDYKKVNRDIKINTILK